MNRDEQSDKNLDLAITMFAGLLDEPSERWPESGTLLVIMPLTDRELADANAAAIAEIQARHPAMAVTSTDMIGAPSPSKAAKGEPEARRRAL